MKKTAYMMTALKPAYQKPLTTAVTIETQNLLSLNQGSRFDGEAPLGGDTDPLDPDPWA